MALKNFTIFAILGNVISMLLIASHIDGSDMPPLLILFISTCSMLIFLVAFYHQIQKEERVPKIKNETNKENADKPIEQDKDKSSETSEKFGRTIIGVGWSILTMCGFVTLLTLPMAGEEPAAPLISVLLTFIGFAIVILGKILTCIVQIELNTTSIQLHLCEQKMRGESNELNR